MTAVAPTPEATSSATRIARFTVPFVAIHLASLLVFIVGWSPFALAFAVVIYLMRGFGITGVFHRKFSHHAYKTGRKTQFVFAWLGTMAAQGGPLWWVAHHRRHHRVSDEEADLHSPVTQGLVVAHHGWLMKGTAGPTHYQEVEDLAKFPELRWLDRFTWVPIVSLAVFTFIAGIVLGRVAPWTNTDGPQLLIWSFFIGSVVLWHVTFSINSMCHRFGKRHHETSDDSRNNWLFGILALGEGWHNNHHRFPGTSRHGFKPSQVDFTYRTLRILSRFGLVTDMHPVPDRLWLSDKPQKKPVNGRVPRGEQV
jgi:stearoyl-CoA desaturase (Delta-9 desaturase)